MISRINHLISIIALLGLASLFSSAANPVLPVGVWTNITPAQVHPSASGDVRVFMQGMAFDPSNPSTVYVCVCGTAPGGIPYDAGLWKTTNGGSNWVKIGHITSGIRCGDTLDEPLHVRVDPDNPQHLYCVDGVRGCSMGFWVSNDGGNNWHAPAGYETWRESIGSGDMYDIAVDPTDFNHILLSFHGPWRNSGAGVAESTDGGNTWTSNGAVSSSGAGMSVWFLYRPDRGIGNSQTWLLGTQGDGFWRTSNGGATWNKVSSTPIAHGGGQIYYARDNKIYAATDGKVMRSADNGITWTSIPSSPAWHNGIGGDGTRIYTAASGAPMMSTLESDGLNWTNYTPTQTFVQCPYEMSFDSVNNILYNASWGAGIWALKVLVDKPSARISGAPISVTCVRGESMAAQNRIVTVVNPYGGQGYHLSGPVVASKKSSWLTVSVDAAKVDSQVITNTINPSLVPDAEARYYDTVTVHAEGADAANQTYFVQLWIKNPSVLSSIAMTPNSPTIAGGQSVQLTASALDQYGGPLASQPSFTWTTSGGNVSSSGLYTSDGCPGSFTVTASSAGINGQAAITVTNLNASQAATATASSGSQVNAVKDGVVSGHPVDGTKEWISNGEKAGAWVQLSWTNSTTIDSIALWDRPNGDDQVLSGTLSFSDGSNISVGTLPDNASSPWSQKFAAKNVTWVKFTVNTVKSTTANIGLAEFGVYKTNSCSTKRINPDPLIALSIKMLEFSSKAIFVNALANDAWHLDLFNLNGVRIIRMAGQGKSRVVLTKEIMADGFSIARLTCNAGVVVERIVR